VNVEAWRACKAILDGQRRPKAARKHLLSGLLTCTRCGKPLVAGIAANGKYRYEVYKHQSAGGQPSGGCGATVRKAMTDQIVRTHIRNALTFSTVEALAPESGDLNRAMKLRGELARIDLRLRELEEMWGANEFSTASFRKQRADRVAERTMVEGVLSEIEQSNAFAGLLEAKLGMDRVTFTGSAEVGKRFEALSLGHRKAIVSALFPRIEVRPGRGAARITVFDQWGNLRAYEEDAA
jgi:hypothetical protein